MKIIRSFQTQDSQPPLTKTEMLERIQEIALNASVDASDQTERVHELIQRIREGLDEELQTMAERFQDFHVELDEFEAALSDDA